MDQVDSSMLSPDELRVLQDRTFMPLKFSAARKLEQVLALLRKELAADLADSSLTLPAFITTSAGKISRGENYHTYAYRVLDYPSAFDKEHIFAFRTLILWGHHIGFHLLLTGDHKAAYEKRLIDQRARFPEGTMISQAEIPWQWFADENRHIEITSLSEPELTEICAARKFLKLTNYMPLEDFHQIPTHGLSLWQQWATLLFG